MGHAGFDQSGRDIVCAAISILVINTINSIEELAAEKIIVDADEKAGTIECHFPNEINEKATLLMDSMVLGLKGIEHDYGNYGRKGKGRKVFELIIKEV
jgi:hypothetical protein